MPNATQARRPFLLRPRSRTPAVTGPVAEWQVLTYLAADNDLEGELRQDLLEMERVGLLPGKAGRSPIRAEAHTGGGVEWARGLSIYFPGAADPSVRYRQLDFAQRTAWAEFLDAHLSHPRRTP